MIASSGHLFSSTHLAQITTGTTSPPLCQAEAATLGFIDESARSRSRVKVAWAKAAANTVIAVAPRIREVFVEQ